MKKKSVVKRKASHKAATNHKETKHPHAPSKKSDENLSPESQSSTQAFPEDQEQAERVDQLVKDVREAFTRNSFAIPGDIDLQIRGMAQMAPHHAPAPELQRGPGALPPAA